MTDPPHSGSLAIVCPRYGTEVLGGAETVVREIAERLVSRGWPVEVLCTTALDHLTWANHYSPGLDDVNGVKVRRFETVRTTKGKVHAAIGRRIGAGHHVSFHDQERWINDGFRSPSMYRHLLQNHHEHHTILLTPYMFWTTYACSQVAPSKNVIRPCLHDEPFAYMDLYKPLFEEARGILFNSPPERDLAKGIFRLPERTIVAGEGMTPPVSAAPQRFREKHGIWGDFILYAGRREWGKNVDVLVEFFSRYAQRNQEINLVLMGKGDVNVPEAVRSRVHDFGFVDEQDKHDAFAAATVVCQPSQWESFSRLLMDAWLGNTPVLAFGGCEVTAFHTRSARGGFVYEDYYDFESGLSMLLHNPGLRSEMGASGRKYVIDNYSWDDVMDRISSSISEWSLGGG